MKYLLVRLGSLGDVIHAIPAVAALRAHDPAARVDWLVDPRYTDVVGMVRGVDRVIPIDPRGDKLALLFRLGELRRTRYDAVFDVQGLIKSAVLTWLVGAKRTFGLPPAHLVTAGFDPLRDEGAEYTERLRAAGVPVGYACETTMVHGFANILILSAAAAQARTRIAAAVHAALAPT